MYLPASLRFPYRHAFFHAKKILPEKDSEKRSELVDIFVRERDFLIKRQTDYNFYRYTKREMKKKWVLNDLRELTYLILLDLFYPEKSTFRDSREDASDDRVDKRTTRRVLRDRYPEIFFSAPEDRRQKVRDGRLNPFSTLFSIMPDEDDFDYAAYQLLLIASSAEKHLFEQEINLTSYTSAQLRMAEPEDMIGFRTFWEETNNSIRRLNKAFGPVHENAWLLEPFKTGSALLELFYVLIEDAIALRWYRSRKSTTRMKKILQTNYRMKYSMQDAIKAIDEYKKWFSHPHQIFDYISRAAYGFQIMFKYDTSRMLYEAFLNNLAINKLVEGLCHRHLAWSYYLSNNPRKYRQELNIALNLFHELKNSYHSGITLAYLTEANILNRNKKEAQKSKKTAIALLRDSNLVENEICRFARHMADCAHSIKDDEWELNTLEYALDVSSKLEDERPFMYFNNRLLCLFNEDDSWKINDSMWRVSRNMDYEWEKTNDWYYMPVYSLEVMREVFNQPI